MSPSQAGEAPARLTCGPAMWCDGLPSAPLPAPRGAAGAKGQGTVVRPSAGVRSWAPSQREQQCSPCTALRILPARTVSVLSLRQPSCWLRGFAATTHPHRPADSIRSASTCQGLRCSSSKAEEDTVQPLLSLSLARELEGAAGSSKLQLHAVHPSPHPCTPLHPSLHPCTPLYPHRHPCTHAGSQHLPASQHLPCPEQSGQPRAEAGKSFCPQRCRGPGQAFCWPCSSEVTPRACSSTFAPAVQWEQAGPAPACLALGCGCRKPGAERSRRGLLINHLPQLMRKRPLAEAENVTGKDWSGKISHFRRALEKRFDVMKMSHP